MTTPTKRECRDCDRSLPKRRFSKSQWKKGRGESRCEDCIAGVDVASATWLNERDDDDDDGDASSDPFSVMAGVSLVSDVLPKETLREMQANMLARQEEHARELKELAKKAEAIGAAFNISPPDMTLAECLDDMCNCGCVNWLSVDSTLKSHPGQAREKIGVDCIKYNEGDGDVYPLHVVLRFNPPLNIVKALVRANPDAFDREQCEMTPLRRACSKGADSDTIRYLLDATLRSDRYYAPSKYNPIDFIVEDKTGEESSKILLEEFPAGAILTGDELLCPLDEFITTWPALFSGADFTLCKLCLLLEAAERAMAPKERQDDWAFRPLHSFLRWITRPMSPKTNLDPDGIMPLVKLWLRNRPELFHSADDNGFSPVHTFLSRRWPQPPFDGDVAVALLDALLEGSPGLGTTPVGNGRRLPFHLALANEWPAECVQRLLVECPGALHVPDPVTHLYPFQLASCKLEAPTPDGARFDGVGDDDISNQLQQEEKAGRRSRQLAECSRSSSASYQLGRLTQTYTLLMKEPTLVSAVHTCYKQC